MEPRILLVGATGLVGQGVLKVLQSAELPQVTVLVRRPFHADASRVRVLQLPEFTASALSKVDLSAIDVCLYCAGPLPLLTTEEAYREATVGVLERVSAAYAKANPGGYLIYISGAAANARSRWMPLRVKGLAESVPQHYGLASTALRPGGIRPNQGERSPHRWRQYFYAFGNPMMALAQGLLPGHFTTTQAVGRCMLALARSTPPHPAIVENRQIGAFAQQKFSLS